MEASGILGRCLAILRQRNVLISQNRCSAGGGAQSVSEGMGRFRLIQPCFVRNMLQDVANDYMGGNPVLDSLGSMAERPGVSGDGEAARLIFKSA